MFGDIPEGLNLVALSLDLCPLQANGINEPIPKPLNVQEISKLLEARRSGLNSSPLRSPIPPHRLIIDAVASLAPKGAPHSVLWSRGELWFPTEEWLRFLRLDSLTNGLTNVVPQWANVVSIRRVKCEGNRFISGV